MSHKASAEESYFARLAQSRNLSFAKIVLTRYLLFACCLLFVLLSTNKVTAQTIIEYVYDERGRLIAVIDQSGETAVYNYDAVGNLLSITRRSSTAVSIISFTPKEGSIGSEVTIYGTGFSSTPSQNTVKFNGTDAKVLAATATKLTVQVRAGTTSGNISVTTPTGTATSSTPFTIVAGISVTPSTSRITPGSGIQFTATVSSLPGNQSVVWSVDGIAGGNADVGTISASGLYTAPNQPSAHVVRATSVASPTVFGEAQVSIINPDNIQALMAPSVAVKRGSAVGNPVTLSNLVSVYRGVPGSSNPAPFLVAVRYGSEPGSGVAQSEFVAVTKGPHITSITPSSLARGTSAVITVSGVNLSGATNLTLLDSNGQIEPNVTVSNISVNSGGTTLTATLTANSSAALGQRIAIVSTPNGGTTRIDASVNRINIVP